MTHNFLVHEQLGAVPPFVGHLLYEQVTVFPENELHEAAVVGAPEHVFENMFATVMQSLSDYV